MRYWFLSLVFCSVSVWAGCPQWPLVIAHRGASGYTPEHSLAAYQLALQQGADFLEVDLVPSKDGVLISRHENELSHSTDVASRAEFADRYTKKQVDGIWQQGWFSEDFTLLELRQLKLKESLPQLRKKSAAQDGQYGIVTLAEVLQLLANHKRQSGRDVGIYIETKHPSYFASTGLRIDNKPIQQDLSVSLVDALQNSAALLPKDIYIQSFEVSNLVQLKTKLLPAAGLSRVKLVQLLGDTQQQFLQPKDSFSQPFDLYAVQQGLLPAQPLTPQLDAVLKNLATTQLHYGDLITDTGLAAVASYADGIGPWRQNIYATVGAATPLLSKAEKAGLVVHPYTFRQEQNYLLPGKGGDTVSMADELAWLYQRGIAGVFSDFPDIAVQIRAGLCTKK